MTDCITRSGEHDPIHALLRTAVCVPTWRYLWVPKDGFTFVPALSDTIYGDGRALFRLTTCNSRPQFYVIRCDSGWDYSNFGTPPTFGDFVEKICWDLEDQFGCARLDCEEDDPKLLKAGGYPWPALDDENGTFWGRMDWPKVPGIVTIPKLNEFGLCSHTLLDRALATEDQFSRWADDGDQSIRTPQP